MTDDVATHPPLARERKPLRLTRIPPWIASTALLVLFLLAWEAYVRAFEISAFLLPPPSINRYCGRRSWKGRGPSSPCCGRWSNRAS